MTIIVIIELVVLLNLPDDTVMNTNTGASVEQISASLDEIVVILSKSS